MEFETSTRRLEIVENIEYFHLTRPFASLSILRGGKTRVLPSMIFTTVCPKATSPFRRSGRPTRQSLVDLIISGQFPLLCYLMDPIRGLEGNDCLPLLLNSPKRAGIPNQVPRLFNFHKFLASPNECSLSDGPYDRL